MNIRFDHFITYDNILIIAQYIFYSVIIPHYKVIFSKLNFSPLFFTLNLIGSLS